MSFIPEDDLDYLRRKELKFELKTEQLPDGNKRNGIIFPEYALDGNLRTQTQSGLVNCGTCALLILIPVGYATTQLDSFYTQPFLKRANGSNPDRANDEQVLFGGKWQFWSRHLDKSEWRIDIDGIETYLQYVRAALRKA